MADGCLDVPPFTPGETRRAALARCTALLRDAGLFEPEADARVLLEDAAGVSRLALLAEGDAPLGDAGAARLTATLARRLAREPVFRILGRRAFWTLDLLVTPDVLDPRPDTETVVTAALDAFRARAREPLRVLDLGTGTGAILLALLGEWPRATGIGLDRSAPACAVARRNADLHGLGARAAVVEGDFAAPPDGPFDLVASNPPYVESAAIATLDPEVRDHDPRAALDGGPDGLGAYRAIAPTLPRLLGPGGVAVFEVGAGQAAAVATLLRRAGLADVAARRDLGGHERVILGRKVP